MKDQGQVRVISLTTHPTAPRTPSATDATRHARGLCLSIVAPAYNEAAMLDLFFARLEAVLEGAAVKGQGISYEIICINDGSRDHTLVSLLAHHRRNPQIKVVDLSRNFGKELAMSAGLDAACGDLVVPMDVDLQDPPELIPEFLAGWERGYDVVYGVRVDRSRDTRTKRWTSLAFYRLFNSLSDVSLAENAGDFRLMDRKVVDVLRQLPERNRFMKGLFAWVGFQQLGVPFVRPERSAGATSWRYWTLWNFALDGILAFSSAPVRVWAYVGVAAAALAFLAAAALIVQTLMVGNSVPGYPSLAVMLLMSFGVQTLAIGMLGEYVARIYQEVKRRPLYIVAGTHGFASSADRAA